jgi:hypothetical protein
VAGTAVCAACGGPLTERAPRFVELWGLLQQLDAVLKAWDGEPQPLATLLPERPRFVTDLTPPAPREGDSAALAELLRLVAAGRYGVAHEAASEAADAHTPRGRAALAIACERRGDSEGALREWTAALEGGEWEQARMARGSLLARAGQCDAAAADLALAGESRGAGWNRASVLVHRAIARTPGLPDRASLAAARAEAGEPSAFWSDFTVGRLVWALFSERMLARREAGELLDSDLSRLRDAEDLFEHSTFWDRAMVLVTYARLELSGDVTRVALPLARDRGAALLAEPVLRGAALAPLAQSVAAAYDAATQRQPRAAWRALYRWMRDESLRRYRVPCAACGKGSVGIEEFAGGEDVAGESPAG